MIRIEGGSAHVFEMGYRGYEAALAGAKENEREEPAPKPAERPPVLNTTAGNTETTPVDKAARLAAYERKRELERRRRQRERRFAEIEAEIMGAENRLLEIDDALGNPANAAEWEMLRDLTVERSQTKEKLDALYERWAEMERHSSAGLE